MNEFLLLAVPAHDMHASGISTLIVRGLSAIFVMALVTDK